MKQSEAREQRDPSALWRGLAKAALAIALPSLTLIFTLARIARRAATTRLQRLVRSLPTRPYACIGIVLPRGASACFVRTSWVRCLFAVFVFLTCTLGLFVLTRPAAEGLSASLGNLTLQALVSVGAALPGMFISVIISLLAWIATQLSRETFN